MRDEHIYKSHNKTLLLYHLVFPAKYRKKVFFNKIDKKLSEVCIEYLKDTNRFVEIRIDKIMYIFYSKCTNNICN